MDNYDYYSISSAPAYESCVQAPYEDKWEKAAEEADDFLKMLCKKFRNMPYGMSFMLRSVPYGTFHYYEIQLRYIPDMPDHLQALLFIEKNLPDTWEDTEEYDVQKEILRDQQ